MNIVVTGCSGFVGIPVCRELIRKGHRVFGVARNKIDNLDKIIDVDNFSFYKADITDSESLKNVFIHNRIDCVIHLAAYIPKEEYSYQQCSVTNYDGVFNLLEMIRIYGVSNLIFASTQMVYSRKSDSPIMESISLRPDTFYGLSKKHGEELSEYYALNHNVHTFILRFSGIYGKGKETGVVQNFINQALLGQDLIINQKNKIKDIIYIKDAVKLIINALENIENTSFAIVNAGGISISLYHLAKKIISLTDSDSDIIIKKEELMGDFQLSMSKAKNMFRHLPMKIDDCLTEIISSVL